MFAGSKSKIYDTLATVTLLSRKKALVAVRRNVVYIRIGNIRLKIHIVFYTNEDINHWG